MLAALVLLAGPEPAPPPRPVGSEPALRRELLARVERDQAARTAVMPLFAEGKPVGPDHPVLKRMADVDAENRAWLKELVDKTGWPGTSRVGPDGAHAAWLLAQHADADRPFQKRCLDLLRPAVAAGEAEGKDLAYLTDRVLVGEGKKQLYGTQLTATGGTLVPSPIEDEGAVDARRKAVGLGPLAEYVERTRALYAPKKP